MVKLQRELTRGNDVVAVADGEEMVEMAVLLVKRMRIHTSVACREQCNQLTGHDGSPLCRSHVTCSRVCSARSQQCKV